MSRTQIPGNLLSPPDQSIPTGQVGAQIVIYVRLSGNDVTGDGSLGTPYLTVQRALRAIPLVIPPDESYTVDLSGMGTIDIPGGMIIPPFIASREFFFSVTPDLPGNRTTFPVNIRAALAVDQVVLAADVVSAVKDPVTGMYTVTVTGTPFVAGALVGLYIVEGAGYAASGVILSNTTSSFVCTSGSVAGDLTIYRPSVVIRNPTNAFDEPAVKILNCNATIGFYGIEFQHAFVNSLQMSLLVVSSSRCVLNMCKVDGLGCAGVDRMEMQSSVIHSRKVQAGALDFYSWSSYYFGIQEWVESNLFRSTRHLYMAKCGVDDCAPVGNLTNRNHNPGWSMELSSVHITNARTNGVFYAGGPRSTLRGVTIDDSALDGVFCKGPGRLLIDGLSGSGNGGAGLRATRGTQVEVFNSFAVVDITGATGDLIVGVQPNTLWTNFLAAAPTTVIDSTHFAAAFKD